MTVPSARFVAALTAGLLVFTPGSLPASDQSDVLRARAVRHMLDGDYQSAMPLLERAVAADPDDAHSAEVAGQCAVQLGRYERAEELLTGADRPYALFALSVARYHLESFAASRSALDRARAAGATGPEADLYDALLLLEEGDRPAALDRLAAARRGGSRVEPIASYYEGLASANEGDRLRARVALQRVVAADPDGPWGNEARRRLNEMGVKWFPDSWASVTIGAEWDNNVVLRGQDVILPREMGDEDDWRAVWSARVGIELFRTETTSGGVLLTYAGSAHGDLDDFDTHYPIGSVWIDRRLSEKTTAHLEYDFGYAWVDGDSFLKSHTVTPALFHDWNDRHSTQFYFRAYWVDFRFDRPAEPATLVARRNRDGHGIGVGAEHSVALPNLRSDVRVGAEHTRFGTRGRDYTNTGYHAWVGSRTRLPADVYLSLHAGYEHRPFRHSTSFRDPTDAALEGKTRRDRRVTFEAALERAVTPNVNARVSYRYEDNASNTDVFDYDRSILGVYATVHFD